MTDEAADPGRLLRENRALQQRLSEANRLLRATTEISTEVLGESYLDRILARVVSTGDRKSVV